MCLYHTYDTHRMYHIRKAYYTPYPPKPSIFSSRKEKMSKRQLFKWRHHLQILV